MKKSAEHERSRRSRIMRSVRSKDTAPEKIVRTNLHRRGYRFRLHKHNLPGQPDIVLPKYRLAIFVNGCFWHQHHGCKKATIPKNNRVFWKKKLTRTIERDGQNLIDLQRQAWGTVVLWECEINTSIDDCIRRVVKKLECPRTSR